MAVLKLIQKRIFKRKIINDLTCFHHKKWNIFHLNYIKSKGLRDLDKYKSSEWLLKKVAICLSFGFCKKMSEMLKSPNRKQKYKVLFSHMFCDNCFFLKYFQHFWHCYASTVFFTWIIIYIRLYMSYLWKQFPDEMLHQKTFAKKNTKCFLVLGFRSQHFRQFLQNPKL